VNGEIRSPFFIINSKEIRKEDRFDEENFNIEMAPFSSYFNPHPILDHGSSHLYGL
jgi:hypothetical protein